MPCIPDCQVALGAGCTHAGKTTTTTSPNKVQVPNGTHSDSMGLICPSSEWRPTHSVKGDPLSFADLLLYLIKKWLSINWHPLE